MNKHILGFAIALPLFAAVPGFAQTATTQIKQDAFAPVLASGDTVNIVEPSSIQDRRGDGIRKPPRPTPPPPPRRPAHDVTSRIIKLNVLPNPQHLDINQTAPSR